MWMWIIGLGVGFFLLLAGLIFTFFSKSGKSDADLKDEEILKENLAQIINRVTAVETAVEGLNEISYNHVVQKIVEGESKTLLPADMKRLPVAKQFSYDLMVNGKLVSYGCEMVGTTGSGDALIGIYGFKDPIPGKRVFAEIAKHIEAGGKPTSAFTLAA